jgi:hypothetical protein
MSLYVCTRMWRVGEKRVFDSDDDDEGENSTRINLVFYPTPHD